MGRARNQIDEGGEAFKALANVTISTADFANLVGLTPAALRLRIGAGFIPMVGHGTLNLVRAVQGFLGYEAALTAKVDVRAKSSGRARINKARADEIEARLARQMRDLIHRESAEFVIDSVVKVTVSELRKSAKSLPLWGVPKDKVRAEIDSSIARIQAASEKSKEALRTGDFDG